MGLLSINSEYLKWFGRSLTRYLYVLQEDIKSLSTHVVENFGQTVDKVLYVNTFKALRQKYEQQQDRQKERSQAPLEKYVLILTF